ncbi:hypothetical protein NL676_019251 [Syzygium grande]|nr:hypothetical protein NL676_019251 [Syzygium grande]
MEASLSLPSRSAQPRLRQAPATSLVTCGLRNSTRRPLWRSDVLSTEAVQAVQSLKLAKSTPRLNRVLGTTLARLLKSDLLNVFAELKRQDEVDLALKSRRGERLKMRFLTSLLVLLRPKRRSVDLV